MQKGCDTERALWNVLDCGKESIGQVSEAWIKSWLFHSPAVRCCTGPFSSLSFSVCEMGRTVLTSRALMGRKGL